MKLAAIILAAGYSSRMVDFKPLLRIGRDTVIQRCIDLFKDYGHKQTIVVTGHRAGEVEKQLMRSATPVFNPDFDAGMYSSICRGVQNLKNDVDGFFLLPVDIPLIRSATIEMLQNNFDGTTVLYPTFNERRGHPPLIPARYIPEILGYNGDGGLKKLLKTFENRNIPVWDRTILMDMDTLEDYDSLTRFHATMDIGTREEVLILAETRLPSRGLAHGKAVAHIGLKLGEALSSSGAFLNLDKVYNAGLLHDIAKGHPDHEQTGAMMVERLGLTGLVQCIQNHRDCVPRDGALTEVEIVCLADKLAKGDRPVTVQQRFEQKLEMYAGDEEACQAIRQRLAASLQIQQRVEEQSRRAISEILGMKAQ
jgi:molybdenum cofactor cytidylyltransferase